MTSSVEANLSRIRERVANAAVRAGCNEEEITLVAVAKTFPAAAIREAYAAGLRHFGENRVQEFESKESEVSDLTDATFHLIGHLQSNKARRAASLFDSIDSVDDLSLAQKLSRCLIEADPLLLPKSEDLSDRDSWAGRLGGVSSVFPAAAGSQLLTSDKLRETAPLQILIEVHLGTEETKSGIEVENVSALVKGILSLPLLDFRGLMCIPPFTENPEDARPYFRRLRELRDSLESQFDMRLPVLSMGMSHDFEVAIEEGATEIRVGTAIFGSRT